MTFDPKRAIIPSMRNRIESSRVDLPTKEKVLPKEELNQSAISLIEEYKRALNMLEEFREGITDNFFGVHKYRFHACFDKGEVQYRVSYRYGTSLIRLANEEDLRVSKKIQKAGRMHFFSIELKSRVPLHKYFPGGAIVRYYSGDSAKDQFIYTERGLGQMYIEGEKESNTPLALEKAREMLAGLSSQQ